VHKVGLIITPYKIYVMKTSKNYKSNLEKLPKLTRKQLDEMHGIEREAIAKFTGEIQELESALGMLRVGYAFGWKVLYIIHNKRTIRKYESYLDIDVKEYFDEVGSQAERNYAFKFFQKMGQFWKIVSGDVKVEKRKEID
jgi:hypothetical protein